LIGPRPLRSVPVLHIKVAILAHNKDIDPLFSRPIKSDRRRRYFRYRQPLRHRCTRRRPQIGPCPLRPVPVIYTEVVILARDKGIDPLFARVKVSNYRGARKYDCSRRRALIGPGPFRPVPVIHMEVTVLTDDKGIDLLLWRLIKSNRRGDPWRCARRRALIGPLPLRSGPVIDVEMVIRSDDKGIDPLFARSTALVISSRPGPCYYQCARWRAEIGPQGQGLHPIPVLHMEVVIRPHGKSVDPL